MGVAAGRVAMTAAAQRSDISGQVRITASDIFAATFVPQMIVEVRKRAPALEIDLIATDGISDLMRREADIAIRHVRPEQPDLVARLVNEATGRFYASSDYLNKRGRIWRRMTCCRSGTLIEIWNTWLEWIFPSRVRRSRSGQKMVWWCGKWRVRGLAFARWMTSSGIARRVWNVFWVTI
jgi:DNA-binding transcriptional LysR family regulator